MYMPALPASEEEAIGKVPRAPDCTETRFTGARHSGCEGVAVGVELEVDPRGTSPAGNAARWSDNAEVSCTSCDRNSRSGQNIGIVWA